MSDKPTRARPKKPASTRIEGLFSDLTAPAVKSEEVGSWKSEEVGSPISGEAQGPTTPPEEQARPSDWQPKLQPEPEEPPAESGPAHRPAPTKTVEPVRPGSLTDLQTMPVESRGSAVEAQSSLPAVAPLTSLPMESLKTGKPLSGIATDLRSNGNQPPAVLAYGRSLPVSGGMGGIHAGPQAGPALLLEVLDDDPERVWSEDELLLVEQVTDQLTLALENARLFEEARLRNEELTTLNQIASAVSTMMELDQVLPAVLASVLEAIEYECGLISLVEANSDRLYLAIHQNLPGEMAAELAANGLEGTIFDLVHQSRRTLYIPDLAGPGPEVVQRYPQREVLEPALQQPIEMGFNSTIGIPLMSKGVRLGVVCAFNRQARPISASRIGLLEAIGQQVGVVIENVGLFEQTQRTRDALQDSERYQKGVAQAVAALTERGIAALTEVLEILGHASQAQRVHYLETQVDQNGPYWRMITEWRAPGIGSQLSNPLLRRLGVSASSLLVNTLETQGYALVNTSMTDAPAELTNLLQAFGAQSVLLFAVAGRHELPGCVIFEQTDRARIWLEDQIAALQTAAAALSNTIAREDLFTQVQANLAETEAQYQASSRLNSATSFADILTVLRQHTILGHLNTAGVMLNLFDRPWRRSERAEWLQPIAGWRASPEAGRRGGETMAIDPSEVEQHPLAEWKTADLLLDAERPTMVLDVASDPRLDDTVRDLYVKPFAGRSLLFAPLNVSGRWIGHIVGIYNRATGFPEQELRRLTSLAGQAAVAIEGLRLVDETRRRNEELDTLNKIISTVSQTLNLDPVLDEILQRVLGAIGFEAGLITMVDARTNELTLSVSHELPAPLLQNMTQNGMTGTLCEMVFHSNQTLNLPDLFNPPAHLVELFGSTERMERSLAGLQKAGIHSYLGVPLMSKGAAMGTICTFNAEAKNVPASRVALLEAVARQVGVVIENARLFQGTQVALNETESLYEASAELNAAHAYDDILGTLRKHTVLGQAATLMLDLYDHPWLPNDVPEGALAIARWERTGPDKDAAQGAGQADNLSYKRRLLPTAPAAQRLLQTNSVTVLEGLGDLFQRSDPRLIDQVNPSGSDTPLHGLLHLYPELRQARVAVMIPLLAGGQRIGHTLAVYPETIQVAEEDVRRLTALGGQAAVALQTLRLLDESQRRARQLQTAAEIARDTSSTLALDALLGRTANLVRERFGYDLVSIFLVDEASVDVVVAESTGAGGGENRPGYRLPIGGQTVVGQVTGTGRPLVLNDLRQVSETQGTPDTFDDLIPARAPGGGRTGSELCIPLKIADRVIGALDVQSNRTNAFSDDDLAVMQTLADQLAVAVDNAQAYELTRKAMEEIREADRLKTQFLANMSHELRTPLNSIIGFSRVILKGIDGAINDQQTQDLTAIYNSGQHLLGLINDVLDLSRIEAGKMDLAFEEGVSMADIIKSVMSTTIGLVKDKPIELRQRVSPELPLVTIDPMKVRQVLINLLSNASKFTEEGTITVEAEPRRGENGREEIIVRVIDSGPGIALSDQAKLFQPFSQVDGSLTRKTGGSGLGLSICQHLIRMHGGQISLTSEVGKGTTFFFILPVRREGEDENLDAATDTAVAQIDKALAGIDKFVAGIDKPEAAGAPPSAMAAAEAAVSDEAAAEDTPLSFAGVVHEPMVETGFLPSLVLAVDRDPQVTEMYRRYLAAYNVTVISLSELDQIATVARSIQPVAITLDVAMQGRVGGGAPGRDPTPLDPNDPFFIDGWQVLKNLKKDADTQNIPVIVCTLANDPQRAFRLGADGYLLKPILEDDLVQALQKLRKDK